ncbi:MAG: glycosyl hydrolase family 18 protein, partial [Sphingomicrobium sp.]
KVHRKGAKLLVSLGGGTIPQCSGDWAKLLEPSSRDLVVRELVDLVQSEQLDGVDVDLEGELMTRIDRAGNYTPFIEALAAALHSRGKLLTCATASYEGGMVPDSSLRHFDLIGIMSYDAIGPTWGEPGSEHSTLAQAQHDLALWLGKGVPPHKLALGLPFYGYGFGAYRRNYTLNDVALEFGDAATTTDSVGRLCAGCDYITYNGLVTLRRKAALAAASGAGAMVWEVSQDLPGNGAIRTVRAGLKEGSSIGSR